MSEAVKGEGGWEIPLHKTRRKVVTLEATCLGRKTATGTQCLRHCKQGCTRRAGIRTGQQAHLAELVGVGVNACRAEDGLDVRLAGGIVAPLNRQKVCCDVPHAAGTDPIQKKGDQERDATGRVRLVSSVRGEGN